MLRSVQRIVLVKLMVIVGTVMCCLFLHIIGLVAIMLV
jgi:hypothetical protein